MVWDGKVVITESGNSGYYPRTCVGIKADGTVVLFQPTAPWPPVPWAIPQPRRPK